MTATDLEKDKLPVESEKAVETADNGKILRFYRSERLLHWAIAVPFLVRVARDGLAFTATALSIALLTLTIFLNLYPRVLVSSTDPAYSLTIWSTSSNHYSLVVMSIVALTLTPIVVLYQGWTYHVFRHRIGRDEVTPLARPTSIFSGEGPRPGPAAPE